MEKEIDGLRIALHNPPRPYISILGGAKADDSLRVANNLIKKKKFFRFICYGDSRRYKAITY